MKGISKGFWLVLAAGVLIALFGVGWVWRKEAAEEEAKDMIRGLRSYPLLKGFRGGEPADEAALADILVRVAAMAEDLPGIAELDCNPVVVSARGGMIVDARVRVEERMPPLPLGSKA